MANTPHHSIYSSSTGDPHLGDQWLNSRRPPETSGAAAPSPISCTPKPPKPRNQKRFADAKALGRDRVQICTWNVCFPEFLVSYVPIAQINNQIEPQ